MKKLLLASSALVAAAAIATPAQAQVEVTVGGFYEAAIGFGSNDNFDDSQGDQWGFRTDAEIIFSFQGTTDNGLTFGGRVEMEASDEDEGDIDETWLFVSGDFGRITVGFDDGANEVLAVTAPGAVTPYGINDGTQTDFITNPGGTAGGFGNGGLAFTGTALSPNGSSDNLKIVYLTPTFSGFRAGVSFEPTANNADNGDNSQFIDATRNQDYAYGVQAAVQYDGEFDGIGVLAAAGLAWASAPSDSQLDPTLAGQVDDYFGYNLGLQLSYGGFSFGGSFAQTTGGHILSDSDGVPNPGFNAALPVSAANPLLVELVGGANQNDDTLFDSAAPADSIGFDVGAAYSTGPIDVGLVFFYSELEGAGANNDAEQLSVLGGVSYALGNGLDAYAGLGYTSFDNEAGGAASDNDGIWGYTGIVVSF